MWILLSAVITASLLGSMHCVGMCGPLAIWASGASEGRRGSQFVIATALYHIGRLLTYMLAGLLAGAAGQLVDLGGQALGVQLVAARVVGSVMVGLGVVRLYQLLWRQAAVTQFEKAPQASLITRTLVKFRPFVFGLPIAVRGLVTGLLTALLPCGWLYLFALAAAGTGSVVNGPIVMAAFWLGTVPALVALVSGTQFLGTRFRRAIPVGAALLLVLGGCYTAAGRGFAGLHSLSDITTPDLSGGNNHTATTGAGGQSSPEKVEQLASAIDELVKTPLPCCVDHQPALGGKRP